MAKVSGLKNLDSPKPEVSCSCCLALGCLYPMFVGWCPQRAEQGELLRAWSYVLEGEQASGVQVLDPPEAASF